MAAMKYEISLDPARMDLDVIHGYLSRSYWSEGIRREVVAASLKSSVVVGAFEETAGQVGFARVVTDRATFAWLCDVFVLEEHRGRGLSKRMVQELVSHPELQTLRRWCLATRDAQGLYERFGFAEVPSGRWYELRLPTDRWKAAPQER
jgi:GNAT superfamily N-acetyltransferase